MRATRGSLLATLPVALRARVRPSCPPCTTWGLYAVLLLLPAILYVRSPRPWRS